LGIPIYRRLIPFPKLRLFLPSQKNHPERVASARLVAASACFATLLHQKLWRGLTEIFIKYILSEGRSNY
jgi:hypothetical protein